MATTASDPVVILSYARTPMGSFQGSLAGASATDLGATAVRAAVERAGIPADLVQDVIMGQVVQAGSGQNPARQAAIRGGVPSSAGATTVNMVCGSGLKAVINAAQAIKAGDLDAAIAQVCPKVPVLVVTRSEKGALAARGGEHVREYRSSAQVTRTFCGTCGSSLQFLFDGLPELMWIAAGTFDDVPDTRPEAHIFVGSKAPWHDITDDLPCHPEYPGQH